MSLSTLYVQGPYVHSNAFNVFVSQTKSIITREYRSELLNMIALYEKYKMQLEAYEHELYSFCHVTDYTEFNRVVFGTNTSTDTLDQIAYRVIREPSFFRAIVPNLEQSYVKDVIKSFGSLIDGKFADEILQQVIATPLPLNQIYDLLRSAIKETNGKSISKETVINQLNNKEVTELIEGWSKRIKNIDLNVSGKKNQLTDIIKTNLKAKQLYPKVDEGLFKTKYKQVFKELCAGRTFQTANEDINTIADEYANIIYTLYSNGTNLSNISNILGDLGEYIFQFATSNAGLQLDIEVVGAKSEKEVAQLIAEKIGTSPESTQMKTFHDTSKQSMTDIVMYLTNDAGVTKAFRVQSKNSALDWLKKYDQNVASARPMIVGVDERNTAKLLELLEKNGFLNENQTKQLAYYIANIVWFSTAGSISHGKAGGKLNRGSGKTKTNKNHGGLNIAQQLVNQTLAQSISAFVGLTIGDVYDLEINPSASNIFYLLGARTLFPVSLILQGMIDQLRQTVNSFTNVHYQIIPGPVTRTAADVYDEKRAAVDHLDPTREYQDQRLVDIGIKLGQEIVDNTTGRVLLKFNLTNILRKSSFIFSER